MRIVLGISIALSLATAGCGGGQRQPEDDSWARTSSSDETSGTSVVASGVDAGVDSGSADPRRDRALALFTRSCAPCHRRMAPVDADAIARGVYLETEDDIRSHAHEYTIGLTPTSLASVIAQRAEGYELMVGRDQHSPMPPRGTSYPSWTVEEAQEVRDWMRTLQ